MRQKSGRTKEPAEKVVKNSPQVRTSAVTPANVASWTLPAHAALFTGLYDASHGVVHDRIALAPVHGTLAEALRDAGYQTAGFYGGPYLHPGFGIAQGFETWRSAAPPLPEADASGASPEAHGASHRGATGPATVAEVRRWLAGAGPEPIFLFVHLWDVHYDYTPPAEYVDRFDPDYAGSLDGSDFENDPAIHAGMPERDLEHLIALYDGEIRFTDDILGEILSLPEAGGRLERALVAVTADHGEEFFEHGDKGHQRTLFDEVIRIPLALHWPGHIEPKTVVREQVRLIDVMPTLLSLAGVPAPDKLQGRDLSPALRGEALPSAGALLELRVLGRSLVGMRGDDILILRSPDGDRVYDLRSDPGQTEPLPASHPATARARRELEAEVRRALSIRPPRELPRPPVLDAETERRLEALGYRDPAP